MDDVDAEHGRTVDDTPGAARALERVVDPVVAVDDGTVTYANAAARDAFGIGDADRDAATALGTRWDRLAAAIDETTVGTARRIDLEGDAGGVRIHRGADGATITFDRSVVGSQTDADETDGSLAEGSLADASDRLVKDRALAAAPVGVTISDPDREDNPLVYVNEAYQEITGYEFDEVVGRNCRFLQGPESDEDTIAEMAAAIDEKRPVTVELKNYRKDGTEFWNEVTIAPVRDESGRVTNYVGFQNDVTARKEAELALEERTAELEYILDRVEGLIQDVTDVVAGSTDRSTLESEVCARIAAEDAYEGPGSANATPRPARSTFARAPRPIPIATPSRWTTILPQQRSQRVSRRSAPSRGDSRRVPADVQRDRVRRPDDSNESGSSHRRPRNGDPLRARPRGRQRSQRPRNQPRARDRRRRRRRTRPDGSSPRARRPLGRG